MSALRPPFKAEDMEGLYKKVIRGKYSYSFIFKDYILEYQLIIPKISPISFV